MKPKGTILRLAVLSLLLLAVFVQSTWAVDKIVVGAWNIENLGKPKARGDSGKDVPQQAGDIADYIKSSGVHVLALGEINAETKSGTPSNGTLDEVVKTLGLDGASWAYKLFRLPKSVAITRLNGVIWNEASLKPVGRPIPLEVPGNSFHLRGGPPWAMKFSAGEGKADFVIIPVHMKSNYLTKPQEAVKTRVVEAELIVGALSKIRQQLGDDIIIIGDVNALHHSEEAIKIFVDAGFRDLNEQDLVTYIHKKYKSPLDRAFVPNKPKFADCKMEVFKPTNMSPEEFREKLSDHYMIKFTVKVMSDDD